MMITMNVMMVVVVMVIMMMNNLAMWLFQDSRGYTECVAVLAAKSFVFVG